MDNPKHLLQHLHTLVKAVMMSLFSVCSSYNHAYLAREEIQTSRTNINSEYSDGRTFPSLSITCSECNVFILCPFLCFPDPALFIQAVMMSSQKVGSACKKGYQICSSILLTGQKKGSMSCYNVIHYQLKVFEQ